MYPYVEKKSRSPKSASKIRLHAIGWPLSQTVIGLNLLCLATLFLNSSTYALDKSTQSLGEVEVSAGRLESKQFDTPAATYFVDSSTVANTGNQVNLSDALNLAPGVVSLNSNN